MNVDEALAVVKDATPHEDVEAWIAQVLAAAVERVREECANVVADRGHARRVVEDMRRVIQALDGTP